VTDQHEEAHHAVFAQAYELIAAIPAIEDVSFHPPGFFPPESERVIPDERRIAIQQRLQRILTHWIPKYAACKTTISIESHITPQYFCFNGPDDYVQFIQETPNVGALLDVAHNHFDGFDNAALIAQLGTRITGLHLSDTDRKVGFPDGLHLEIGQGEIDFQFLQTYSWQPHVFGAIEVKGQFQNIRESVQVLTQRYLYAQKN
jgi:sugar phosphate isomerase/epimerase